jgi:hypothetical protein
MTGRPQSSDGLIRFVDACGHRPMIVSLPERI